MGGFRFTAKTYGGELPPKLLEDCGRRAFMEAFELPGILSFQKKSS
jgi:hypothetical protein